MFIQRELYPITEEYNISSSRFSTNSSYITKLAIDGGFSPSLAGENTDYSYVPPNDLT